MKTTVAKQTDNNHVLVGTQTELGEEHPATNEMFVTRINFDIASQEECTPNEEPPTMTGTRSSPPQLEASHHEIADKIVATVNQTRITEAEEDTPLFRQRLQKVLGVKFITAATKKDRNFRPLINFVKKRDWEAIKSAYGQYWFNIHNRLHVREDCLLIDERIVIPTQLRETILESLYLTHPGSAAMLDLYRNVWFPHIHRSIVQMAKKCKHCTEQGKNLKPIKGKNQSFQMDSVVEPNEEVQLNFAGPLPDELNKDAYILIAIDKWSKFPAVKIVSNTTPDIVKKIYATIYFE